MKKRILAIIVLAALIAAIVSVLASCGNGRKIESADKGMDDQNRAIEIIDDGGFYEYTIYRDKRTGVEYLYTKRGVTPMYNADGSLFTEGEEADG